MNGADEEEEAYLINAVDALRSFPSPSDRARRDVDIIWRAIADQVLSDEDTAYWARLVAKDVVSMVLDDASDQENRPKRALKALQLNGKLDFNFSEIAALQLEVDLLMAVERIEGKDHVPLSPAEAGKRLAVLGFGRGVSQKALNDRAGRMLKKLRLPNS
jgi:hypothetical protein